jgi:hypothetical protein
MSNPAEVKQRSVKDGYDYIIVGAGASGSVIAGELSKTGADVLVVEAGGADEAPTISNPSIWFYNVGSPLDWALPIAPVPQLNNRKFNMALGHVLGGGSAINALVDKCRIFHDRRPRCRAGQGRDMMREYDHVLHCRRSPPHSSRHPLARYERCAQPGWWHLAEPRSRR